MQIVIDIPDGVYEVCRACEMISINEKDIVGGILSNAVAQGTLLPKGHGRLIDADELYDSFIDGREGYDCHTWSRIEIGDLIEDTPTIVPADKGEEEE